MIVALGGAGDDGRGHPFWFAHSVFADLTDLHGDKAVWKLLDVDTWVDYERLLRSS